jgi:asparagine synthase (glutamine-hydrolysing)
MGFKGMCGIVGFIGGDATVVDLSILKHRGPDSLGQIFINKEKVLLGHTRLAIQDLSESGAQPMASPSGRFIITFNGEIYNHIELRKLVDLDENHTWLGSSDTETLTVCFEQFGVGKTIEMCDGMFAMGVWDSTQKQLYLVRDRFGEKPLYYGIVNGILVFASELKALKAHPSFTLEIDRESLAVFFKKNFIPSPYSIYKDIYKVMPGTIMCFDVPSYKFKESKYWSLRSAIGNYDTIDESSLLDSIDQKLKMVVQDQLISDVPIGAFLSGGVDSSLIVSIMQAVSKEKIRTFSIGFHEQEYNEADQAEAVAKFLGTNHETLIVDAADLIEAAKSISEIYDEPFADYSQIPTYLVSKFAREKVSVVLTGDGGDELFGGYNRHIFASRYAFIFKIPKVFRRAFSWLILSIPQNWYSKVFRLFRLNLPVSDLEKRIVKISKMLNSDCLYDSYEKVTESWGSCDILVKDSEGFKNTHHKSRLLSVAKGLDVKDMMAWDIESYLTDGVLVKLDRAAMSVSLEGRVPFLNHKFAELAWGIPTRFNMSKGSGKVLLRKVLGRYIPGYLIAKPKRGFSLPMSEWLRGPLFEWADQLLSEDLMSKDGYINAKLVQEKWLEHQEGRKDWSQDIWCVLIFQMWLEKN